MARHRSISPAAATPALSAMLAPLTVFATLALIAPASASPARGQDEDPRVQWLRDHAVSIGTVDPANHDYADLAPLKVAIGDARIVQLGEQSHGDGTTFRAKTRLIGFLHEEMGFDVIAFESGFYDCRKAWEQLRAGVDPYEAAQQGIFGIWTRSAQVRPLLEYLGAQAKGERPLVLCGFDCQFTGKASRSSLAADLRAFLDGRHHPAMNTQVQKTLSAMVGQLAAGSAATSVHQANEWRAAIETVRAALDLEHAEDPDAKEVAFWRQFLRSALAFSDVLASRGAAPADATLADAFNPRDRQMADNLLWLAREQFPDRKIIVWAATMHIARNPNLIETGNPALDYTGVEPMGHLVSRELGSAVYTIGFTAYQGAAGLPWAAPWTIAPAAGGSLEDLCARAGLEHAFIPFRGVEPDSWLRSRLTSRPLAHAEMRADWTRVLDAMVFSRTMTASTMRE